MSKISRPRRGSLAFSPRKRAKRIVARIRSWPAWDGEPRVMGFAGYKVGMTHVIMIEDYPNSPLYGSEVAKAVTILETPPMRVAAIRAYEKTIYGLRTLTEVWAPELHPDLRRVFTIPKDYDFNSAMERLESLLDRVHELRLIVHTQPRLSNVRKKKPEVMEYPVYGGDGIEKVFEYAKSLLGGEIRVSDVFKPGELVDVVAITKGKGIEGPVYRWGIKILPRKTRKRRRAPGTLGPWTPSKVSWRVPRAGQTGFHQRTEYNKRILMISDDPSQVQPAGGFPHYGIIRSEYVLIEGSVPGHVKRLIRLRPAIRPPKNKPPEEQPKIIYIHK